MNITTNIVSLVLIQTNTQYDHHTSCLLYFIISISNTMCFIFSINIGYEVVHERKM